MAIRIDSIDAEKSHPSDSQPHYVANLSSKMSQTEIVNLEAIIGKARNQEIMNVEVKPQPGNVLTFDTRANVALDTAVQTIQGWLSQLSGAEEQFKQNIKDVNEKLAARKDLDKPRTFSNQQKAMDGLRSCCFR
jgi:hypothetical protein